jgi:ethanolamine utilization microcompartment shell protein EutS
MELRALTVIDSLQPQLTGFLQTVCAGFMPLEQEAAAFIEIAPGIAINQLTDAALKATTVRPGMQIVERAYGMLEFHDRDKGQVEAAIDAIVERMGVKREDRIKPRIVSSQIITGMDGHQSQLINRMRHGDMIMKGQTLYILEVYPAAYAAIAANEAEKAADVHLMEVITFGAFGRLWLGGWEAEVKAAAAAAEAELAKIAGREEKKS